MSRLWDCSSLWFSPCSRNSSNRIPLRNQTRNATNEQRDGWDNDGPASQKENGESGVKNHQVAKQPDTQETEIK